MPKASSSLLVAPIFTDSLWNVFSFLPPKSVCAARAVCKEWYDLITNTARDSDHWKALAASFLPREVLNPGSVVRILAFANAVGCHSLRERCLQMIKLEFCSVIEQCVHFSEMKSTELCELLKEDELVCGCELQVLEAVFRWYVLRANPDKFDRVLDLLTCVRWPNVPNECRDFVLQRAAAAEAQAVGQQAEKPSGADADEGAKIDALRAYSGRSDTDRDSVSDLEMPEAREESLKFDESSDSGMGLLHRRLQQQGSHSHEQLSQSKQVDHTYAQHQQYQHRFGQDAQEQHGQQQQQLMHEQVLMGPMCPPLVSARPPVLPGILASFWNNSLNEPCPQRNYMYGVLASVADDTPYALQTGWPLQYTQQYVIGRSSRADVRVGYDMAASYVSGQHFRLFHQAHYPDAEVPYECSWSSRPLRPRPYIAAYIEDLSQNGTYVNGVLLKRGVSQRLKSGDTIELVFTSADELAPQPHGYPCFRYYAPKTLVRDKYVQTEL